MLHQPQSRRSPLPAVLSLPITQTARLLSSLSCRLLFLHALPPTRTSAGRPVITAETRGSTTHGEVQVRRGCILNLWPMSPTHEESSD
eukprot:2692545-Rhodomonas_salina.1